MSKKKTKGKAAKTATRKKPTKPATSKRTAGKAAKSPRKTAATPVLSKGAFQTLVEPPKAMDLLRAWSPSRYSKR